MSNATRSSARQTFWRGLKFYAVGGVGIGVQLAALVVFRSVVHLDYRAATVLAVEVPSLIIFFGTKTLRGQIGRRCVHRTGCRGSSNSTRRTGCSRSLGISC